jgi:peptidoglycan/LPS O-acetylase OafA/YrhL
MSGSTTQKIVILDVARGVCAFIVALYHFLHFENQHGSFVESSNQALATFDPIMEGSICVFFIISGYVMYMHMERNNFDLKLFLPFMAKRAIRLLIPMLVCIAFILSINALFQWYLDQEVVFSLKQLIANLTLSANFVGEDWYNPIFWTLSIEFQFYLVLALSFKLIRKDPFAALIIITLACTAVNHFFYSKGLLVEFGSYFTIGIAMFLFSTKKFTAIQLLIITVLGAVDFLSNQDLYYCVIPLISIPILLFVKTKNRFLQFQGETSYSFYLFHGLLGNWFLYFLLRYMENTSQKAMVLFGAFAVAYVGSYFFYRLIEKPSLKLVKRIRYTDEVSRGANQTN